MLQSRTTQIKKWPSFLSGTTLLHKLAKGFVITERIAHESKRDEWFGEGFSLGVAGIVVAVDHSIFLTYFPDISEGNGEAEDLVDGFFRKASNLASIVGGNGWCIAVRWWRVRVWGQFWGG